MTIYSPIKLTKKKARYFSFLNTYEYFYVHRPYVTRIQCRTHYYVLCILMYFKYSNTYVMEIHFR